MAHVEIQIETGNSAFGETGTEETARILRGLAHKLDAFDNITELDGENIRDINGNVVGYINISEA